MFTPTQKERTAISELCARYGVARLELFGSATEDRFDAARSDLDFLVEFIPDRGLGPWLGHYFDLKAGLEDLFGRSVDLVMPGAVRNPYFAREMNRTRTLLYAA